MRVTYNNQQGCFFLLQDHDLLCFYSYFLISVWHFFTFGVLNRNKVFTNHKLLPLPSLTAPFAESSLQFMIFHATKMILFQWLRKESKRGSTLIPTISEYSNQGEGIYSTVAAIHGCPLPRISSQNYPLSWFCMINWQFSVSENRFSASKCLLAAISPQNERYL